MLDKALVLPLQTSQSPRDLEHPEEQIARLRAVHQAALELYSELDLDRLLHKALAVWIETSRCSAGALLLLDAATGDLVVQGAEGNRGPRLEGTHFSPDRGIAGSALERGELVALDPDTATEPMLEIEGNRFGLHIRSAAAAPLVARAKPIGVLLAINESPADNSDALDTEVQSLLATHCAIAIENARAFSRLAEDREQVLSLEEAVRHEAARNLHDGPAQILTAVIMSVRFLKEALERAPEQAGDELVQLEALGQKALHQVRNILFELRPAVLETDGIGPALEAYVGRVRLVDARRFELELTNVHSRIEPAAESAVFSIVQEAVNNARRHAGARRVRIEAAEENDSLFITVKDDGCGFDPTRAEAISPPRSGYGLRTMRRRARLARAALEIESAPDRGTTVTLRVPICPPSELGR